ncbi:ATP-binding protein [Amycolatopsis thermalba]|uniref:ATP-binding protein n=1 Tax=Amycolatopsis thermalba TaxID=944492 RepID=A0ABY4NU23_9PSEU|nr:MULTISPECIES: ATP-binding protein [Amycolatopsis]UQS23550.1 ATP-binding protein [Amycolatopsis thermalba]
MDDAPARGEFVLDLPDPVPPLVRVRRWIAAELADLGDARVAAVQLVATELLTNAYDHGGGHGRIRLSRSGNRILVEVDDGSPDPPLLGDGNPKSPRGRGLVLADRLSAAWGHRLRADGGKAVWAVIDGSAATGAG